MSLPKPSPSTNLWLCLDHQVGNNLNQSGRLGTTTQRLMIWRSCNSRSRNWTRQILTLKGLCCCWWRRSSLLLDKIRKISLPPICLVSFHVLDQARIVTALLPNLMNNRVCRSSERPEMKPLSFKIPSSSRLPTSTIFRPNSPSVWLNWKKPNSKRHWRSEKWMNACPQGVHVQTAKDQTLIRQWMEWIGIHRCTMTWN